jgi:hypothetical protein
MRAHLRRTGESPCPPSPPASPPYDLAETGHAAALPVTGAAHRLRVTLLMAGSCLPILGAVQG